MRAWLDGFDERSWQRATEGTVRYALIGLGWWTTEYAVPAIESSDLGRVTTLVSRSAEKARRLADEHDVAEGIGAEQFHDGAASEAYDAVYVCTPNAHHFEYVETAADLDKAVLCEKPIEASVERAERLVEACESADVPLMIAYRMHTDPAVRRARELIADGFLGEPVSAYGTMSQRLMEMNPDRDQWRLDPEVSGYGTSVMDLGIYPINTARFLLDRDVVAVQSRMASPNEAFADVPDERATAILELEGDVEAVATASQNAHRDSQLTLTGTEGRIDLRPAFHGEVTLRLSRGDLSATVDHEGFDAEREMAAEFDYFADRVLTGGEIEPDGRHGLTDLRIVEAIHEAAETDAVVEP